MQKREYLFIQNGPCCLALTALGQLPIISNFAPGPLASVKY